MPVLGRCDAWFSNSFTKTKCTASFATTLFPSWQHKPYPTKIDSSSALGIHRRLQRAYTSLPQTFTSHMYPWTSSLMDLNSKMRMSMSESALSDSLLIPQSVDSTKYLITVHFYIHTCGSTQNHRDFGKCLRSHNLLRGRVVVWRFSNFSSSLFHSHQILSIASPCSEHA
jgi:hypothetical protein